MPTDHILALLVAERDKLNRAIEVLGGQAKRRGRPPKSAGTFTTPFASVRFPKATTARMKRTFTAAQRAQQAARMRAYWAKRRKQGK